jgi:hypothetical protein
MEAVRAVAEGELVRHPCLSSRGLVVAWARCHVVTRALIAFNSSGLYVFSLSCVIMIGLVVAWAPRHVVARALIAFNSSGLYVFSLSCVITTLTAAATKTKPIGDDDDRQFTIIINGASTAVPIGLPLKMAEFCHTPNRLLLGRQCRRALLRLYFNSSATGRWSVVGRK